TSGSTPTPIPGSCPRPSSGIRSDGAMISYLLRRVLLLFPTLIGATALVFFVMELSPVTITSVMLNREGTMRPGEEAMKRAYLEKRYGLGRPAPVRYLKWLNAISPVGIKDSGAGFPGPRGVGVGEGG